jgi:hypothetical protein
MLFSSKSILFFSIDENESSQLNDGEREREREREREKVETAVG